MFQKAGPQRNPIQRHLFPIMSRPHKRYDAVATIGEFTDRTSGEKRKRYASIGTVFANDEGKLTLKLDLVPIVPGWSGYVRLLEPGEPWDTREASAAPRALPAGRRVSAGMPMEPAESGQGSGPEVDDLPF